MENNTVKHFAVIFNQASKNYPAIKNNPNLKARFDKQVKNGTILNYEITDGGVIVERTSLK